MHTPSRGSSFSIADLVQSQPPHHGIVIIIIIVIMILTLLSHRPCHPPHQLPIKANTDPPPAPVSLPAPTNPPLQDARGESSNASGPECIHLVGAPSACMRGPRTRVGPTATCALSPDHTAPPPPLALSYRNARDFVLPRQHLASALETIFAYANYYHMLSVVYKVVSVKPRNSADKVRVGHASGQHLGVAVRWMAENTLYTPM